MRSWIAFLLVLLASLPTSAASLEGCVYTPDGTLVSNARVTAGILEQPPLATVTTPDGCFAFTSLPDSLIALRIDGAGQTGKMVLALPNDPPLTITMNEPVFGGERVVKPASAFTPQRDGGTITGLVHIGAKPLAGAPVILDPIPPGIAGPLRVITDAKGRFQVSGLPRQRYVVTIDDGYPTTLRRADAARMDEEGREPSLADLTKDRAATIDFAFVQTPLVTGRIVDADNKPVRGARVQVILSGRSRFEFINSPSTRTNADGRYTLAAPPFEPTDPAVVIVRAPRHSSVRSKPFHLRGANVAIDITLPKFELVTVRVLDPEKKPVANARVAFAESEEAISMPDTSYLLLAPYASEAARSNAEGEVALHLTPDSYDFAADAETYQLKTIADRTIAQATSVDIPLVPAFSIRGRVHRNNRGVAKVNVTLLGDTSLRETATITDAEGRFTIDGLARNSYRLTLAKYDELVRQTIEAKAPSTIDIPLDPAGTMQARVFDAGTREPVREFVYSIEPLASDDAPRERRTLERGVDAADGTFRATLPTGTYRVTVSANGFTGSSPAEVRVTEREPAMLEVALDRGLTVTGRVIDETSTPVEGADVVAMERETQRRRMGPGPANTRTAADGTFTLTGISGGEISLSVRKDGFVPFRQTLSADTNLAPVDVRLSRGLAIEGTVTRAGKPVADAQVAATTSAIGGEHQPAITDATGHFVLRGLITARYTVSAYKDEMHAEVRNVDPSKQREVAISLDDQPRGILYGTVTGVPMTGSGKVTRRTVFVASEENGSEGMIDDAGNYRIEDAPVGPVFVTAQVETTAGGLTSARKSVVTTPGQAVRVDLDLTGSVRVSGRVLLDGRPLSGARVTFSTNDGMMSSAISRDDGAYEISLGGPGRFRIFAFAERMTDRQFSTLRDIRGGETIDLDLREQIIEGTVVDAASRQPIDDAIVTLTASGLDVTSIVGEVRTDPSGRFRLTTSNAGPHRVTVSARGYAHRLATINLGTSSPAPLMFELSPVSELRVRILDARTSASLEAHVYLTDGDGNYIPVRAERSFDGTTYSFYAAPGKYRLAATVFGYAPKTVEVTAPGSVDVTLE